MSWGSRGRQCHIGASGGMGEATLRQMAVTRIHGWGGRSRHVGETGVGEESGRTADELGAAHMLSAGVMAVCLIMLGACAPHLHKNLTDMRDAIRRLG